MDSLFENETLTNFHSRGNVTLAFYPVAFNLNLNLKNRLTVQSLHETVRQMSAHTHTQKELYHTVGQERGNDM